MAAVAAIASLRVAADRIPMQWGFDGEPTWYAPRVPGFFLVVAIAAGALGIACYAGARGWTLNTTALVFLGAQILHLVLLRRWLRRI